MKLIFSALVLIVTLSVCGQNDTKSNYKTENVIIIVMDGPRYTETWGDSTHQYIPHFTKDIVPKGVLYKNFYNNGKTETTAGHTAMCTGVYQQIPNNGTKIPKKPSIFQHWLKKSGKKASKAYVISSKDKLAVLSNCKQRKWKGKYRPYTDCGQNGRFSRYRSDQVTFNNTIDIMKKERPNLMLVNFANPDSWGHAGNWEKYLSSMKQTDEYMFKLFEFINTNKHYRGKTTVFMTNDHGRHLDGHKDGFVNHGDGCEGCRHIICFAYGPDFINGKILEKKRELIDIPATIAKLMGFEMEFGKGEVMQEIFK